MNFAPATTTTTPPLRLTGTGFTQLEPAQITSLAPGEYLGQAIVFEESGPVSLPSALTVWNYPQWSDADSGTTSDLPAGTTVCSWFVHVDPVVGVTNVVTMDFTDEVLGVSRIFDSQYLMNPQVDYATPDGIGANDFLRSTSQSVLLQADSSTPRTDQFRVITTCG